MGTAPLQSLPLSLMAEPSEPERLHRRWGARGLGSEIATLRLEEVDGSESSSAVLPPAPPTCGGLPVPPDWPDFSSGDEEQLLAPFFSCASPAEFIALQERVDMPRLVESLTDWDAVRLGALGPVREDAASLLNLKRVSFLLHFLEYYGAPRAEVFALFIVDSSYDDDLREMLFLLARDKHLAETLKLMPAFREHLEARGLAPLARADRDFQWSDVGRGLGRFGRDALSPIEVVKGGRELNIHPMKRQLPPPYEQAFDEVERELAWRHFAPGNVAQGTFDHVTFGVPLGFYHLVAGTGQGLVSLTRGEYEQATRELAPAVLLVAVYAGGKGVRAVHEARGATNAGLSALQVAQLRARALGEVARRLEATLGVDGLRELARDIGSSREAGRFVAVGGLDAALALREARGEVARAQALMSRARPGATGSSSTPKAAGAGSVLASLVDEGVGLTREVVEARLALVELEAQGPRLPRNMAVLKKHRPSPDAPLPGGEGNPRWGEYVAYYERRLKEIAAGKSAEGPLHWKPYERMWGWFTRGLAFERLMLALLEADAKLPRAQRRFLGAFLQPRIERYVGVWKPGSELRFADVLVIEEGQLAGGTPRVETFSFKSRDLSRLDPGVLEAQMKTDAREALWKYGGTLDIRRGSLQPLFSGGSVVPIQRIRLIYEGGALKPNNMDALTAAVNATRQAIPEVEVLFQ
ncbi:MAG TPA: hypothetical protein VLQ93_20530 [Myxococcaceae bacterium]|nr:hypothetical protein [Myxococcaceae bacterium]